MNEPYKIYHIAHICCCDDCKGQLWSHSQSDFDSHLRYVDHNLVIPINPNVLSIDKIKRFKQIKMLAGKHRAKLRSFNNVWRKFTNGYWYVGTEKELNTWESS